MCPFSLVIPVVLKLLIIHPRRFSRVMIGCQPHVKVITVETRATLQGSLPCANLRGFKPTGPPHQVSTGPSTFAKLWKWPICQEPWCHLSPFKESQHTSSLCALKQSQSFGVWNKVWSNWWKGYGMSPCTSFILSFFLVRGVKWMPWGKLPKLSTGFVPDTYTQATLLQPLKLWAALVTKPFYRSAELTGCATASFEGSRRSIAEPWCHGSPP